MKMTNGFTVGLNMILNQYKSVSWRLGFPRGMLLAFQRVGKFKNPKR
jgi:hypothetical protein